MARFDCFRFLSDRKDGIVPSNDDMDTFDLFQTNRAFSMSANDPRYRDIKVKIDLIDKFDALSFHRLEKKHQCMAYTALNDMFCQGRWIFPKKEASNQTKISDLIDKLCKIFDCGDSTAREWLRRKLYTPEEIDMMYTYLFDRDSLINKKSGTAKK
jgi:hypothetical protein